MTYHSQPIELIFLGTGTSASLPHIECLTALPGDETPPCKTCLSTQTPEGKKNIRRNTSATIRMADKNGLPVTVVIDAGKNFQAAALEWFPKYQLRRIDALLITHAHADAMNGLDDLRGQSIVFSEYRYPDLNKGWTLRSAIQDHIDVYVSQDTFTEVQRSFPYLVAKEFASGGGDESVPEFKWHIISDSVSFEIGNTGIHITPFAVHHGRVFSVAPPPSYIVTPTATLPSTPVKSAISLPGRQAFESETGEEGKETIYPYLSFGFKIQNHIVYISDVSHIPDNVWPMIEPSDGPIPVAVLDCLRLQPHPSHVGLAGSIALARRIKATKTYLTGFGHEVSHEEYVKIGEVIGGRAVDNDSEELTDSERKGIELVGEERGQWIRPAHDGLRVFVEENGQVTDESYT